MTPESSSETSQVTKVHKELSELVPADATVLTMVFVRTVPPT